MSKTSVRTGHHNISEVNMAGSRKHVHAICSAQHILSSGYFSLIISEYALHDIICIIIIISVLRCMILHQIQNSLMSFKVVIQSLHQFFHGKCLLIVYIIFYSCQTVCDSSDTNALKILGIVSCSACIVVLSFGNTVICNNRKERCRHIFCENLFDYITSFDLDIDEILHLLLKCIKQLIICLKIRCISQL